jgi:predicted AAA+ superfamily ATPase
VNPYEPRLIDALIERKLRSAGAVVLRGPRAVGKTTSALHHAASSVRLDQQKDLIDAAESPDGIHVIALAHLRP